MARVGFVSSPYSIYFEVLPSAVEATSPPILMIHGGTQSGACYRLTPDGREGWADRFARLGFTCYVADWPGVGRSGYVPVEQLDYSFAVEGFKRLVDVIGVPVIVMTHSMSGPIGWQLLEQAKDSVALVVAIAPGPPGNIQPELGPISGASPDHGIVSEDGVFIHLRVRGADLRVDLRSMFSDSEDYIVKGAIGASTRFPASGEWRPSMMSYPPKMLLERLNWRGRAPRLTPNADLTGAKALIVTGTADTNHRRDDDEAIAHFLRGLGADAQFLYLGDIGIEGNGHMLMSEDNSYEIAELVAERILKMIRPGNPDDRVEGV